MGSECCNIPTKRHYDITMSKRTRKPPSELPGEANLNPTISTKTILDGVDNGDQRLPRKAAAVAADVEGESQEESDQSDRKSLKELINGDGKEESRGSSRNSLSQHFNEEEKQVQVQVQVQHQLQLVKKHDHGGGNGGVKLKGMMSRYAKVLSHLVKIKREPRLGSKKNHLLRFTM